MTEVQTEENPVGMEQNQKEKDSTDRSKESIKQSPSNGEDQTPSKKDLKKTEETDQE